MPARRPSSGATRKTPKSAINLDNLDEPPSIEVKNWSRSTRFWSTQALWPSHTVWREFGYVERNIYWIASICVESVWFVSIFMCLTLYALFVPDINQMCGSKESGQFLDVVTTVVLVFFALELVLQCLGRRKYACRAYFWLDFCALLSLLPETSFYDAIFNEQGLLSERESSLIRTIRVASRSTRATKLNRLSRLVRIASLLPRLAALFNFIRANETERLFEKKLRCIFLLLDDDQDGSIDRSLAKTCVDAIKGSLVVPQPSTRQTVKNILLGRKASLRTKSDRSTVTAGDFTVNNDGSTSGGSRGEPSSVKRPQRGVKSDANFVRQTSPMSHVSSVATRATSTSMFVNVGANELHFEGFRQMIANDGEAKRLMMQSCRKQLVHANNLSTLAAKHTESIAMKVALGVLTVLVALSIIQDVPPDDSAHRGLEHIDRLVRDIYPNQTIGLAVPTLIQEQVTGWQMGPKGKPRTAIQRAFWDGSPELRKLLYLDLNNKVYCNSLIPNGPRCTPEISQNRTWGRIRSTTENSFDDIDSEILLTKHRPAEDLKLVLVVSGSSGSDEERTTSIAVLDVRDATQVAAFYTLINTCVVILIIISGISLLSWDLSILSRKLLNPLRDLADDMQGIADLQLAGVQVSDQSMISATFMGTSEIRLIRRTFEHMKTAIKSWGKYVPWPVVQLLLHVGVEAKKEVKERNVSIFFSDIASFTTIVESLDPEKSLLLLSNYFNDMSKVIDEHGGVVIEFIGDAILCVYGAPMRNAQHPSAAVKATLRMLAALQKLNVRSQSAGLPEVSIRCGVHTGPVMIGNMGFRSRMKYGIVGENASIPGRLEETNKTYGTDMLISEATYSGLNKHDFIIRPIDKIYARTTNDATPELVYQVLGRRRRRRSPEDQSCDPLAAVAKRHSEAMALYLSREFEEAATAFDQVSSIFQEQSGKTDTASTLMAKRCRAYLAQAPPADWNGVWALGDL